MAVNVRYEDNFGKFQSAMERQLKLAGEDIELDLVNAARSTAPHLYGQLERGINGELLVGGSSVKITVGASAIGSNGYDYAPKMHDGKYNLGEQSLAKGQGYSGLTGIAFPVGNNYIKAPAEQGFESYLNYFGDKYNIAVRSV